MQADREEGQGGILQAWLLRLRACRIAATLRRLPPHLLRDAGVEPHALEAEALRRARRPGSPPSPLPVDAGKRSQHPAGSGRRSGTSG